MPTTRRVLEIPIGIEFASAAGSGPPRLNSHISQQVNAVLQDHLRVAEAEGWLATDEVDAQALLNTGDLSYEVKRGLLDSKVILVSARVELAHAGSYDGVRGVSTSLRCPGGDHEASRFDVHCRVCAYYLPSRSPDNDLSLRLSRHWQAFVIRRQEEQRQAAMATAKAESPGVGVTLAKAVGFGLLGLAGGMAREVGKGINQDLEDARSQRNIREGIKASR